MNAVLKKSKHTHTPLAAYGIRDLADVALLLPIGYRDYRRSATDFRPNQLLADASYLVTGRPGSVEFKFRPGVAPHLNGRLMDANDEWIGWTMWGDTREFQQYYRDAQPGKLTLSGTVRRLDGGRYWLDNASLLAPEKLGCVEPVYPASNKSKHGVNAEYCRTLVGGLLDKSLPLAAAKLDKDLEDYGGASGLLPRLKGSPATTLEALLLMAHAPASPEQGRAALDCLQTLVACASIASAQRTRKQVARTPLTIPSLESLTKDLTLTLTPDQRRVAGEILVDLAKPYSTYRVISGDTGCGKTIAYCIGLAAVVKAGGWAAVLVPTQVLVRQVAGVLAANFPSLSIYIVEDGITPTAADAPGVLVGTTALLFRDIPNLSLQVVDEEQKFSRSQREQLLTGGAHLLQISATAIPRTQALVHLGLTNLSMLHQSPVEKRIVTRIWKSGERNALMCEVRKTVVGGGQVMALYPKRTGRSAFDAAPGGSSQAVEDAYRVWSRQFPGRVQLIHGAQSDEQNIAAVESMKRREADILVSTTVAEVGLDLPFLQRVVVVKAERFGLSTLHQIRGRVARRGGVGFCDLFLPDPVKDIAMARLQALVNTQDGFKIAQADLELRGGGDLKADSTVQTGADRRLIFGHALGLDAYERALELLKVKALT